jgi:twitching motility two-component system response regulator PilG
MSDTFEFPLPEQNAGGSPAMGMPAPANASANAPASAQPKTAKTSHGERRSRRRALISAPVRVRSVDVTDGGPDEISTTLDVSRGGVLFATKLSTFEVAMVVAVTFPYSKSPVAVQAEQLGRVARVTKLPDGRYSVAVTLRSGAGEDLVDSSGRKLEDQSMIEAPMPTYSPDLGSKKPLVVVVDKDIRVRDSLKSYLTIEGYEVIALATAQEAHHVLNMFTPALLIAEIEGEDLPGYELCAYVKGTPRLQTVPVMLMTSSAYPSDYANAHSLGAVVCIAKPYRQERLGHVVRLLAPIRRAKDQAAPARPGDASRRSCAGNAPNSTGYTPNIRFRPPW